LASSALIKFVVFTRRQERRQVEVEVNFFAVTPGGESEFEDCSFYQFGFLLRRDFGTLK
jgi:hypothetical protein